MEGVRGGGERVGKAWKKKEEEKEAVGVGPPLYALFPTRMAATIRP